jgi:hypothetical protein|tara:strand:- start:294 stop:677 length:384 start_codon:yes stop_codon:yes gene_type:complete
MFNQIHGRDDRREIEVDPPSSYEEKIVQEYDKTIDKCEANIAMDKIQNPEHYKQGVSPYDVAKSMYGPEGLLKFVTINSVKYIQRYPFKYKGDPEKQLDDLIKAKRSLETAIELHKEIHGGLHIRHG